MGVLARLARHLAQYLSSPAVLGLAQL